jgi:hypothetical protein
MHMLGHHYDGVENVAPSMVEQTMLKNCIPSLAWKWVAGVLTERDEDSLTGFLVMRELSSILIFPLKLHLHVRL